jgi:hypothetical protein
MSATSQRRTLLQLSLHLLAVMVFSGCMLVLNHTTASAQMCTTTNCVNVRVFNCTVTPTTYQVWFVLCCNGMVSTTTVPIVVPPFPCTMPSVIYTPPAGCTVMGVAAVAPTPPGGWVYTASNCTLKIN